jgi:hypothetical protein
MGPGYDVNTQYITSGAKGFLLSSGSSMLITVMRRSEMTCSKENMTETISTSLP